MKFSTILIEYFCIVVECSIVVEVENIFKLKLVMLVVIFKLKRKICFLRIVFYVKLIVGVEIIIFIVVIVCLENLL